MLIWARYFKVKKQKAKGKNYGIAPSTLLRTGALRKTATPIYYILDEILSFWNNIIWIFCLLHRRISLCK
jgi:hypothetical protein